MIGPQSDEVADESKFYGDDVTVLGDDEDQVWIPGALRGRCEVHDHGVSRPDPQDAKVKILNRKVTNYSDWTEIEVDKGHVKELAEGFGAGRGLEGPPPPPAAQAADPCSCAVSYLFRTEMTAGR